MAVNKNFVVKNGIEIATDVIVASSETKNVGIGTTVGQILLDVKGAIGATHISVSGVGTVVTLNATDFTSTNGTITNLTGTAGTIGSVQISSGIITATSGVVTYYGDGQFLSNVISGVGLRTEGSIVGYGVTLIDFRGAGISTITTDSATGIGTINIVGGGGGGATISIGTVFSGVATEGNLWYKSDDARLYIYYQDADSAQWVDASPFNVGVITSLSNVSFSPGSAASPSMYFIGDTQTGFFSPTSGQFTVVSTGSSVLNINPGGINVSGATTTTTLNATGNAVFDGNIGIGSDSPAQRLDILGSGPQWLRVTGTSGADSTNAWFGVTAGSSGYITVDNDGSGDGYEELIFTVGGSNIAVLKKDVGKNPALLVNTTSHLDNNATLQVSGSTYLNGDVLIDGSNKSLILNTSSSKIGVGTTAARTTLDVVGNASGSVVGLGTTDANTTLDFSTANNFSLELTGSIVLLNPTGSTIGQSGIIQIQQDGTGSRTVGFGSHWDFPSATPPTLSTGANALDCITYFVRSSTSIVANSLIGIGTL